MGFLFKRKFKTYGPEMILDVLEDRIVLDATVDQGAQQNQTSVPVNVNSPDMHAARHKRDSRTCSPSSRGIATDSM